MWFGSQHLTPNNVVNVSPGGGVPPYAAVTVARARAGCLPALLGASSWQGSCFSYIGELPSFSVFLMIIGHRYLL